MKLPDFQALTFDCYGTLIDWESGILKAWQDWARREGVACAPEAVLESFARHESRQQRESPGMPYPELLAQVCVAMGQELGGEPTEQDAIAFGHSVPDWPAFPDSADALARLGQHFRLFVLSNIDRASFAGSNKLLRGRFEAVLTAQDTGVYKPDPAGFSALISAVEGSGIPRSRILHVAQSLFHDHEPAKKAGLATCWIDRRGARSGQGATMPPASEVSPDFRFGSMAELAEAHRLERLAAGGQASAMEDAG